MINNSNTRTPVPGESGWISEAHIPVHEVLCISGLTAMCTLIKTDGTISKPTSQYWSRWSRAETPAVPFSVRWGWVEKGDRYVAIVKSEPAIKTSTTTYRTLGWVVVDTPTNTYPTPQKGDVWKYNGSSPTFEVITSALYDRNGKIFYIAQYFGKSEYIFIFEPDSTTHERVSTLKPVPPIYTVRIRKVEYRERYLDAHTNSPFTSSISCQSSGNRLVIVGES